ncbi:MAG: ActD-like protein [Vicinamibacteria bacterium]|nr:ActD-like protein [Vicinamibacteria bacterium]
MMEPHMRAHVPDWRLERYLLSELPRDEMDDVRRIIEKDDVSRERLEALERDNSEILARHPPRLIAAAVHAQLAVASPKRVFPARFLALRHAWIAALAIVAVAGGVSVLRSARESGPLFETGTRIKGMRPKLLLFRQTNQGAEALALGNRARENDVIQIGYQAAGRRYGVIISIDGRGVVTRHMPKSGSRSAELSTEGPMALPEAYRLDDAPRFERFILVASDEPFTIGPVLDATRQALADGNAERPLPLPDTFDQFTFMLNKESSR